MIKQFDLKLAANGSVRPRVQGNYINLKASTDAAATFRVKAYDKDSGLVADIVMGKGDDVKLKNYTALEITNLTAAIVDIDILLGDGEDFEAGAGIGDVDVIPKASATGLAPLVWTAGANKTIAANSARKLVDLMADAANVVVIYIGSTDATKGIPLAAGQSYTLEVTGAIETYCAGTVEKLHIVEVI